jgi:ribosomal protein L44E
MWQPLPSTIPSPFPLRLSLPLPLLLHTFPLSRLLRNHISILIMSIIPLCVCTTPLFSSLIASHDCTLASWSAAVSCRAFLQARQCVGITLWTQSSKIHVSDRRLQLPKIQNTQKSWQNQLEQLTSIVTDARGASPRLGVMAYQSGVPIIKKPKRSWLSNGEENHVTQYLMKMVTRYLTSQDQPAPNHHRPYHRKIAGIIRTGKYETYQLAQKTTTDTDTRRLSLRMTSSHCMTVIQKGPRP